MNDEEVRESVRDEISKIKPPYGSMTFDEFKSWHRISERASFRMYLICSIIGTPIGFLLGHYILLLVEK